MSELLDTHYHFDFIAPEHRAAFLDRLADTSVRFVAQTLTPSSYLALHAELPALPAASAHRWSLGFHPWNIVSPEQAEAELARFDEAVSTTRFIGEIGLDFSPRRLKTADAELQQHVFRRILGSCIAAADGTDRPHVLSIHAVRSATAVLDVIEQLHLPETNVVPVIHWFSGTSDELTRHIRLGGHISVSPRLLTSKRGRAYARQIPADRLLLETDLPESTDGARPAAEHLAELAAALESAASTLAELRGAEVAEHIAANQRRLYFS